MTKKLFYVEVSKSGWVLAENDVEAKKFADKILDTEYHKEVDVFPYTEEYLNVSGWDKNCYVYHNGNGDIKLGSVLE